MSSVSTSHNAVKEDEITKTVLMPGDPLRAKFIVETYLENVTYFNTVHNMFGFTDIHRGCPISVMGDGMGMPSVGIYIYKLFNFYGVESIVRANSAGGLADTAQLRDVIAGMGTCTGSSFAEQCHLPGTYAPIADYGPLSRAVKAAGELEIPMKVGNVLPSGIFYDDNEDAFPAWEKMGVLAVEMEAVTPYMNAARAGKNALCSLVISDRPLAGESLPAEERQIGFTRMMEIALALA